MSITNGVETLDDTHAFLIQGPTRRLFYCPDIDSWGRWERGLVDFVQQQAVDIALLDGCFFSSAELPGRNLAEIPHPLVTDTVERSAGLACEVGLIHLNHTNPLLVQGSERAWVASKGVTVPDQGATWPL